MKSNAVTPLVGLAAAAFSMYVRVFSPGWKNSLPPWSIDFAIGDGLKIVWTDITSGIFWFPEDGGMPSAAAGIPASARARRVTSTSREAAVEWYGMSTDVVHIIQGSSVDVDPRLFSMFMVRSGSR